MLAGGKCGPINFIGAAHMYKIGVKVNVSGAQPWEGSSKKTNSQQLLSAHYVPSSVVTT